MQRAARSQDTQVFQAGILDPGQSNCKTSASDQRPCAPLTISRRYQPQVWGQEDWPSGAEARLSTQRDHRVQLELARLQGGCRPGQGHPQIQEKPGVQIPNPVPYSPRATPGLVVGLAGRGGKRKGRREEAARHPRWPHPRSQLPYQEFSPANLALTPI